MALRPPNRHPEQDEAGKRNLALLNIFWKSAHIKLENKADVSALNISERANAS